MSYIRKNKDSIMMNLEMVGLVLGSMVLSLGLPFMTVFLTVLSF